MLANLTDEELDFFEDINNSVCAAEILFSDFDNLTLMEEDKFSHLRLGQIPLLSHEYILDKDPQLNEKENFTLRKNAGEAYALGGRLFGKTLIVLKIDMLISVILLGAEKCGFTSYDAIHIKGVLEEIIPAIEHHPFFKLLNPQITRSPSYRFYFKNGYTLESINMNITGKRPGSSFFQKHMTRLYMDEASFETEEVYQKRRDAVSELGCVFRFAGMTNFTKYSPCGKIFYDLTLRGKLVNLPQYVNPRWDANANTQAIKDFSGEQSMGYRIFIKGQVVEDGVSAFDMERIRRYYDENRTIKSFELNKNTWLDYETILYLERPGSADSVFICADIGESAPTEIGVWFKIGQKYRYEYNIILYGLTDKEQFKIFRFLGNILGSSFIGIDTTDGTGRAIYRSLAEVFPQENLSWVAFNEKIKVGFEKDSLGQIIKDDKGKPIEREEYVTEWSIKHLREMLYTGKIDLPIDYKLDKQLNSVISTRSGNRTIYEVASESDHIFQAFQVFAITEWRNEFAKSKPTRNTNHAKSGV